MNLDGPQEACLVLAHRAESASSQRTQRFKASSHCRSRCHARASLAHYKFTGPHIELGASGCAEGTARQDQQADTQAAARWWAATAEGSFEA